MCMCDLFCFFPLNRHIFVYFISLFLFDLCVDVHSCIEQLAILSDVITYATTRHACAFTTPTREDFA